MSNERTLPRRRAAASVVSYTREGAKKWSDQCQISAFTASVCDPQRRRRARVRADVLAQKLVRKGHELPTYLHAYAGRNEPLLLATECSLSADVAGLYRFVTSKK